ncbi:MAG: DUF3822 family protein [Candidatus Azobacteroides sp.]|nr:DUF3822 family protein [Candidatus Azobacteroides sp.]
MKQVINIGHPERSILTIYASLEHFSFSLYDPEKLGSYFYRELTGEKRSDAFPCFKDAFFEQSFFSLPFRKVLIMNRTSNFAFVPDSFYKNEYKDDFIRFLFPDRQGITLSDSVSSAQIRILYQLPEEVYRFMLRSFSKPEFIHCSTPVISYFMENSKNVDARQMVINLQENGLDIYCFSKDTFLLGNYFPCKDLWDALYYILFIWKQLKMNQLNDYLHIVGNNAFKEELIDELSLYLQQILLPEISTGICFEGIDTDRIPFELSALSLCEL